MAELYETKYPHTSRRRRRTRARKWSSTTSTCDVRARVAFVGIMLPRKCSPHQPHLASQPELHHMHPVGVRCALCCVRVDKRARNFNHKLSRAYTYTVYTRTHICNYLTLMPFPTLVGRLASGAPRTQHKTESRACVRAPRAPRARARIHCITAHTLHCYTHLYTHTHTSRA